MATAISTAFVAQFSSNVMHLVQQKGSRTAGTTLEENITGEKAFWDQIGAMNMIEKTGHNTDTPIADPVHARRMCIVRDYENAILIDKQDRIKMLLEPNGEYTTAFANAIGRLRDDVVIAAAYADAKTGKDGTTTTSFNSDNLIAVDYVEQGSVANSNLTVGKVRRAAQLLNSYDCEEADRYALISSYQLHALQRDDEFTSRDYNVLQPLMSGQIPMVDWMGFSWRRSERLQYSTGSGASGTRRALFYHKSAIKVGLAMAPVFRIDERSDKSYATQVYAAVSWGGTRMEENRIVAALCLQNA